ncbi:TPR-like protein [Piromyces finnis]|uniref:TPR-like protein n=1 Tax=Piromyces finnis TaxID=1754191 RepID=A0A1Y1V1L2_9FUNG|nr:TPR-like protein [Piromyces finnis]|eukprot:ORX45140.1 TPR-like protein [Piromyces finnis]
MKLRDRKSLSKSTNTAIKKVTKKKKGRTPLKRNLKKEDNEDIRKIPKVEPVDSENKINIKNSIINKLINESIGNSVKELVGIKVENTEELTETSTILNENNNMQNNNTAKKNIEVENDQETILNELLNGTFGDTLDFEDNSNDIDENDNEDNISDNENEDLIDEEEFSEYYDSEEGDLYQEKKINIRRNNNRKGKAPINSEEEEEEDDDEEDDDNEYLENKDEGEDLDNDNTQIPQKVGEWLFEANKSIGGNNSQFTEYSKDFWIDEDEMDQDQEDDLKDLEEEMEEEGKRKRKRKRSGKDSKLSDENGKLLGKANVAYSNKQYQEAIQYLHSIIQSAPNANQAWFLLAIIHEELREELKAFQFYLVAAHITKKDGSLWKRLGLMAKNLNQIEEAIYCYTKAIHTDNSDFDAVWDRSYLYYEQGNYKKAINGYLYILKYCPNNTHVIKELSKLYLKTNNVEKAIILFENAIKASDEEQKLYKQHLIEREKKKITKVQKQENEVSTSEKGFFDDDPNRLQPIITSDEEDEDNFQFECSIGYEEINMLAELYMEINEYEKAINIIRKRCRILQGRDIPEKENMMDDSEFDEDENTPEYQRLPMELRVRLGICRLYLNQINLAVHHFYYLYKYEVQYYPELYFDVGEAYIERKLYTKALAIFNVMEECEQTNVPITWSKLAYCYHQLGNLKTAVDLYKHVLKYLPDDHDLKLALAEVYGDLGEEEKALALINEVDAATSKDTNEKKEEHEKNEPERLSIFVDTQKNTFKKQEDESVKIRDNKLYYQKICLLYPKIEKDEGSQVQNEFLNTAFKLVQRFQNTKEFYPSDRQKKFTGTRNRKKRILPSFMDNDEVIIHENKEKLPESFQGLTFIEWFEVIVKYAIGLAKTGSANEALEVLWNASKANVYYHNKERSKALRYYMLGIALYSKNYIKTCEICRWFINTYPQDLDSYRLYMVIFTSGNPIIQAYASSSSQKFFSRFIKNLKQADGVKNPLVYVIYGHILHSARSYMQALNYYSKAFKIAPEDPIINLSLGLVHLHRAMQRQADNRHLQIMQGLTFIFRYYKIMKGNQEACYNVARSFHQIGLLYLAVQYYEKVLEMPSRKELDVKQYLKEKERKLREGINEVDEEFELYMEQEEDDTDLKSEAAYNLSLIYVASGSYGLSQQLLRKYCTF